MKKFKLTTLLIWLNVWIVSCVPYEKISVKVKKIIRKTGEAFAEDNLIQRYESEHQEFYNKEIIDGDDHLKWSVLDRKDLSNYCRKYLQHAVPSRTTDSAVGCKFKYVLHYEKKNICITNKVVIVRCKIKTSSPGVSYYITRASTPNCVYALKCTGNWRQFIFNIINKYCNFEDKSLINRSIMKQKRLKIVKMVHQKTGQPIAKDEYLLVYELEHKKFLEIEGEYDKHIDWPYATLHDNLNFYCYQYMKSVIPRRNRKSVTGSWKSKKMQYQKLNTHVYINIIAVKCRTSTNYKRYYYMTRAPEADCVYALLRKNKLSEDPLIIVFKHCSFEDTDDREFVSIHYLPKYVIPKSEVKEEMSESMRTEQLFPND